MHPWYNVTNVLSLNLEWQWSSASGLCACSVTISGYLMRDCKRCAGWKKTLHLHYSILTSRLISAQGHQYFWHFSGGINIERMSLCCAWGDTCLWASTKITWICLLACSVGRRDCRSSLRSLSAFNIMHHKHYLTWTIELWKYTVGAREGDDKKSTSCMSDELKQWIVVKRFKFMFFSFFTHKCGEKYHDGLI